MSALVELRERVEKTNALIAQCESTVAAARGSPPPSVLATIRSLEKLKRRLEGEFLEIATRSELEVYRYKLLNESERVTLAGIAEAWSKFQDFFGSVYSAIAKTQIPKGKKPQQPPQPQSIELGYGYSFASSVGVVVTVPRGPRSMFNESQIEEASAVVFDLIEARNVARVAQVIGPGPIKALHEWLEVHVKNQYGLGLEWRSEGQIKRTTEVQYQSLLGLDKTIADTTTVAHLDVPGELVAVDTDTKEFKFRGDNGQEYEGGFESAITSEHAASVPARYNARITQTTKIILLGKEPQTTFFLDDLRPLQE